MLCLFLYFRRQFVPILETRCLKYPKTEIHLIRIPDLTNTVTNTKSIPMTGKLINLAHILLRGQDRKTSGQSLVSYRDGREREDPQPHTWAEGATCIGLVIDGSARVTGWKKKDLSSDKLKRSYPDSVFAASLGGSGIRTWDLLVVGREVYHWAISPPSGW